MSVSLIDGHIDDDVQMTDNEIIKALECQAVQRVCGDCPLRIRLGKQKEVNERLKSKVEELSELISHKIHIRYEEAKVEAIKEFAERVKDFMNDVPMHSEEDFIYVDYFELRDKIDNLVKEMVGDTE